MILGKTEGKTSAVGIFAKSKRRDRRCAKSTRLWKGEMTNRAEEIDGKNKKGKYLKGSKKRALHEKKMKLRKNKRKADKVHYGKEQ